MHASKDVTARANASQRRPWPRGALASWLRASATCAACVTLLACDSNANSTEPDAAAVGGSANYERPLLCSREGDDPVRDVFCKSPAPAIRSLADLQHALGIDNGKTDPYTGIVLSVLLAQSTALSAHKISSLNPRAILLGSDAFMAFQRGVQQVELATRDRKRYGLTLYLVTFKQACNEHGDGCAPGDLYTPRVESDWQRVQLQDDEELKNTTSDCRQCHRRGRDDSMLLMRELESPWTHFFDVSSVDTSSDVLPGVRGRDLLRDYQDAKADERYGGVSMETLNAEALFNLEVSVETAQPAIFDAPTIEDERWPYGPDGYAKTIRPSPTWERAYEAFKRGEQLAIPYVEERASDLDKQAALTDAYARFRNGKLGAEALPDLSDIFPDDAKLRARIGLATEPDATPAEALIQACGSCHNDVLDQGITRARFNIDLSRLDRTELDTAIERIERTSDTPGVMPPPETRQLAPTVRTTLLDFLRDDARARAPNAMLQHASKLGMAGGEKPPEPIQTGL